MSRAAAPSIAIVLLVGLLAADWEEPECPECYEYGYKVDLLGLLGADPPGAVLFSGYRNGRCQEYMLCTGSPDAWLGDLHGAVFDWWNSCSDNREIVLFAGGYAPTVLTPPQTSTSLTPTPNGETTLSIAAWIAEPSTPVQNASARGSSPRGKAEQQLIEAKTLLKRLGSGVTLDYVINPLPDTTPASMPDFLTYANCDMYATLEGAAAGSTEAAMQDASRLNLYFVHDIKWARNGLICYDATDPVTKPYYIFIDDTLTQSPSTVAHELGHAMGMLVQASLPNSSVGQSPGDINELELDPWLHGDNLMMSGVTDAEQITVGQIYRMHFDERSWLRRGVLPAGGYPKTCQANPVANRPCPPLTVYPPKGWP